MPIGRLIVIAASAMLSLAACRGAERLARFEDATGCYKTESGLALLHISPAAFVTDARGTELGIAALRIDGPVSLIEFRPAVVASEDGRRAVRAAASANEHIIDTLDGETILGLQGADPNVPGVLLKRFPGLC